MRAACELLITHDGGMWLRRDDFVNAYVERSGREAHVDFAALAGDLAAGTAPGASTAELGVLRLAADLATDRYWISRMDEATVHLVRVAVAAATE